MPLHLLTDTELNDLCISLKETTYIYYPIATSFFQDLYFSGARPNELMQSWRWSFTGEDSIQMEPEKGNFLRFFEIGDFSESLLNAIIAQAPPYENLTLRQLTFVLHKIMPYPLVTTTAKNTLTYLFRYNLAKILHNGGASDADIQFYFGWGDPALPSLYYLKQIWVDL